jgi:hypothetical protein
MRASLIDEALSEQRVNMAATICSGGAHLLKSTLSMNWRL